MITYEQFLASPHKTAWMDKDDFDGIQNNVLDTICKKLNQNTCDGWPVFGWAAVCDPWAREKRQLADAIAGWHAGNTANEKVQP